MNAQTPPSRWASAMMWYISVVLPEDSGPKTSTMRPRGTPPMPSARSSDSAPVGIALTLTWAPSSPIRMTVPLPNWRSIWVRAPWSAASRAFAAFSSSMTLMGKPLSEIEVRRRIHPRPDRTAGKRGVVAPAARVRCNPAHADLRDDPLRRRRTHGDHHPQPPRAPEHDRPADARRGAGGGPTGRPRSPDQGHRRARGRARLLRRLRLQRRLSPLGRGHAGRGRALGPRQGLRDGHRPRDLANPEV